ncbi:OmpA family protein [Acidithiobacillus montserratensis]|uniref:OmpA family protein n=1 Tax=Acidithiobacillus montserratensis TaxID=2729135 RepID=A0ACD5HK44_9PROT|nr:OmpA family protein [Acidithiobacillus montserratensis]
MPLIHNRLSVLKSLWLLFPASLLLAGCAQEVSPGPVARVQAPTPMAPLPTRSYQAPKVESKNINGPLGGSNRYLSDAELAALPTHLRVHFATNSSQVNEHGRHIALDNARFLLKFPHVDVRLEGNCDQRGTQEYNLALGNRRAEAVARLLEADGVSARRIQMVSFGKDNLLCYANDPQCWQRNRRVDFVYHAVLG